jgi:DNA polymerase I-like protein with 3'-5' exonuclease and polymerase domains
MSFVTLDFETFYSREFSLSKMTTEEYVNNPSFEVIGVAMKIDNDEPQWFSGTHAEIKAWLNQVDWTNSAVLCHNTQFDGAILAFTFGIIPAKYFDTLCMARAIHGVDAGGSLAALAERYMLGKKGTEVLDALGKRRSDFTKEDLARYGGYCINDVNLTYDLFIQLLEVGFPANELDLIDMTLRMYTQPVLSVDDALLVTRLEEIKEEKHTLLTGLKNKLGCETEEDVRKKLASNPQFAALLTEFGIDPPMKISPTTNKETYALAKNDEGFIELTEHDDPFIQQLCAVRLGTKSTIEESRIERFIGIGSRNRGRLPIPLKYYGAHTGRWAGADAVNFQNLPSRDKKKKALKNSVVAPPDHVIINCDSSQIEARVLAWLAGQEDLVQQFAKGDDVYSVFAGKVYKKPVSKKDPVERFVGKTCFASGTLVLTDSGYKPIDKITSGDRLWDGIEWVSHGGVICQGMKLVLAQHGVEATKDHEILTEHGWREWQEVLSESSLFQSALSLVNLLSSGINEQRGSGRVGSPSSVVVADGKDLWPGTTLKADDQRGVVCALRKQQHLLGGINIKGLYRMSTTELGYLTDCLRRLGDVITRKTGYSSITGHEGSLSLKSGETTALLFLDTFRRWTIGTDRTTTWTGLTQTKDMSREILGSYLDQLTLKIKGAWQIWKQKLNYSKKKTLVYDLVNCGPRHRFTVLTSQGPIIASNCVLGLGYGTGAKKLQHTLKTQPPGADLPEAECKRIVDLYRQTNYKIPALWHECDLALNHLISWPKGTKEYALGQHKCLWITERGIRLPNGLHIRYSKLRKENDRFIYTSRKGVVNIWGGAMVENVVQALARIIVGEQMLEIRKQGYRPVLTVHDAAVIVAHKNDAEQAVAAISTVMSTPPAWATGLPVACEAKYGESYGDC